MINRSLLLLIALGSLSWAGPKEPPDVVLPKESADYSRTLRLVKTYIAKKRTLAQLTPEVVALKLRRGRDDAPGGWRLSRADYDALHQPAHGKQQGFPNCKHE